MSKRWRSTANVSTAPLAQPKYSRNSSWKSVFLVILDSDAPEKGVPSVIDGFFSDPTVQELLAQPFAAFSPPSQQSKSAFETKTSAINVATAPNAPYDMKQVKEDALWLSKEAKLDEITALRIVVQECQSRAAALLEGRFSTEELAALQEASSLSQSIIPVSLLSQAVEVDVLQAEFDKEDHRRLRIAQAYLSERRYLLKCVNYILQKTIYNLGKLSDKNVGDKKPESDFSPMEDLGRSLINGMGGSDSWILACLAAIEVNFQSVSNGPEWFKDGAGRDDIEVEWANVRIAEATHILEILFQTLGLLDGVPSSRTVLTWLQLVMENNFLIHETVSTICVLVREFGLIKL
jgi:nuclear pore complex protein Nup188